MCECSYIVGMVSFKISMGFFYHKLMNKRWQQRTVIGIVTVSVLIGIGYLLYTVFQCGVPGKGDSFWLKKVTDQCVTERSNITFGYIQSLINAFTDIALCAMPIPMVWKANLSRREKIVVSSILLLAATYFTLSTNS